MEDKQTKTMAKPASVKWKNGRLILRFLRGSIPLLSFALLASILNTAFNALTPQIIRLTVDNFLSDSAASSLPQWLAAPMQSLAPTQGKALLLAAGAILLTSALSGLSSYFARMGIAKGSETFVKRLRDALYAHIQHLPFSWHVQHQTGEIIQRCTSDVEVIYTFITTQMMEVFRTVFLIALSMSIMFSMNVTISLVAMAFIPIIITYSAIFYSNIAKRFYTADVAEGELSSMVQENLTGVRVVRAFGRERFEIDRFDHKNNAFAALWIRLGRLMSTYWAVGDWITGLQILSVICVGTVVAVDGGITLGEFLAFVSYNASLAWPVRALGRILSEMSKAGVSIERVAYILDSKEEIDPPESLKPPMDQDIHFEQVRFFYDSQKPVLDGVDFTIPAGKTFAILGGTGSGKSTLMHLLNRLYDLPEGGGKITIGAVPLNQINREHLRTNIGMVLQEPFLFSRSIEENIKIAAPTAQRPEVRATARTACVDEAIGHFNAGYDTIVGERGVTLSGGQKQRVAIARMLMQNAPIMVFDDSLSAVDSETDAKIRKALNETAGTATVILISHRITTLMQADCILVLEQGKIAEMGTHEELIAGSGIYKSIYDIQMNRDDRALLAREEESDREQGEEKHG